MMTYLSYLLDNQTPAYANNREAIDIRRVTSIPDGDVANTMHLSISNHVGTHIDFPNHFDGSGEVLDAFPADFWKFNRVQLLDFPCEPGYLMTVADLEGKLQTDIELLLIRTGFEARRAEDVYWENNPAMALGVGPWLRENFPNLRAFGFDSISMNCLQQEETGCEVHREFLEHSRPGNPILIIEDMKLAHVKGSLTSVIVAPLMIAGADGAPVTVLAEEA